MIRLPMSQSTPVNRLTVIIMFEVLKAHVSLPWPNPSGNGRPGLLPTITFAIRETKLLNL